MGKKRPNVLSEDDGPPIPKAAKTEMMIVEELHGKNPLEALQRIADALDDDKIIVELLSQGGSGKDLLNILDQVTEKPKSSEISILFNACESFLLYVSKSISSAQNEDEVSKFKKLGVELCHELLEFHLGYIILLLSGSNTVYQVESSLRLLTSMITCCGQTAKEVLVKLDFEHKNWDSVPKRHSSEIRSAFVRFILSFFIIGHSGVAKEFIEKKTLISSIIPGNILIIFITNQKNYMYIYCFKF